MADHLKLEPYQERIHAEFLAAVRAGERRVLFNMVVGSGKTITAMELARRHIAKGGSVLWFAHTLELLGQAQRTAERLGVVGMRVLGVQAAIARRDFPPATLVIVDECHHAFGDEWRAVIEHYRAVGSYIVGLTATPVTPTGRPLGDQYERILVVNYTEAIASGRIVAPEVWGPPAAQRGIAQTPVEAIRARAEDRRGFVFCRTVKHSVDEAAALTAAGIPAMSVDGRLAADERTRRIEAFHAGDLRVLTNCRILTEGFDAPDASLVVLACKVGSVSLYLQMVGRGLRAAPGKPRPMLVDLSGSVHLHGMPTEDREYALDGDPIRRSASAVGVSQCPECGSVHEPSPVCPKCGFMKPQAPNPAVRRAMLAQISAVMPEERRKERFLELRREARVRGYKPGWAFARFKAQFKTEPDQAWWREAVA